MSKPKLEGKILHDMMRVVFVASLGKFKYLEEEVDGGNLLNLANVFKVMGPLDFNAACWRAIDEGYLDINKKTGEVKVLKTPEKWQFDSTIDHLTTVLPYVLEKLAEDKNDPEEQFLSNYVANYAPVDVMTALQYMIAQGKVATYEIKDVSEAENGEKITDVYLFYSLPENAKNRWGANQFKDQEKLEK